MSKIREALLKRLAKANGKGLEISKGYSSTWKNTAKKLQEEGKLEYRGGKMFLTGAPTVVPKVEKSSASKVTTPKPAVKPTPKVAPKPAVAKTEKTAPVAKPVSAPVAEAPKAETPKA
jgi:hypothetical protein